MQAKNYVIQVYLVCRYHSINDNSCITNMKFLETFLKYSEIVITGTSGGGGQKIFFLELLVERNNVVTVMAVLMSLCKVYILYILCIFQHVYSV